MGSIGGLAGPGWPETSGGVGGFLGPNLCFCSLSTSRPAVFIMNMQNLGGCDLEKRWEQEITRTLAESFPSWIIFSKVVKLEIGGPHTCDTPMRRTPEGVDLVCATGSVPSHLPDTKQCPAVQNFQQNVLPVG
eukprot:1151477-Pelagomonas_calceolata.AAC.2